MSFSKWKNRKRRGCQEDNTRDELDRYVNARLMSFNGSPRDWCLTQRTTYPDLSSMAIDIYSVPAMSSEPERVFSWTKHNITDEKCRLNGETIELLECLKSSFRLGIFARSDLLSTVVK